LRSDQALDSISREKALESYNDATDYTDGVLVPVKQTLENHQASIELNSREIGLRVTTEILDAALSSNLSSAKQHAQDLKDQITGDINHIQDQLDSTEEFINGTFRDGIIYDSEL